MRLSVSALVTCLLIWGWRVVGAEPAFHFSGADVLPPVIRDGQPVAVHTQGLLVTETHYWVTGRLEGEPARPVVLRFPRLKLTHVEIIDISPDLVDVPNGARGLDHPGGFDVDGDADLYVPVSTSHRLGPSLVYRLRVAADRPLSELQRTVAFRVDDHIGAIAWDAQHQVLVGANWDTLQIYRWTRGGRLISKQARADFLPGRPDWQLAVQDWKGVRQGVLLAGGLDKSTARAANDSRAVIQWIDLSAGTVLGSQRLPDREDVSRPVTNEGLSWYDGTLYLLPEDIGHGAKILKYHRKQE